MSSVYKFRADCGLLPNTYLSLILLMIFLTNPGCKIGSDELKTKSNTSVLQSVTYILTQGKKVVMDSMETPRYFKPTFKYSVASEPQHTPIYSNYHGSPEVIDKSIEGEIIDLQLRDPPTITPKKGRVIRSRWPKYELTSPFHDLDSRFHFSSIDVENGLRSSSIKCIISDHQGRVWMSTWSGGGVSVWDGNGINNFSMDHGLSYEVVQCLIEDHLGRIWIGSQQGGLCMWDGSKFTHYTVDEGLSSNIITALLEDTDGRIWIGTPEGIDVLDVDHIIHYSFAQGLVDNHITCLMEDSSHNIWIGTIGGLSVFDGRNFKNFTSDDGLVDSRITCLLEDSEIGVWVGSHNGLMSLYDFKILNYYKGLTNDFITCFSQDYRGRLWIGTNNGVNIWDGRGFTSYGVEEGLRKDFILSLMSMPGRKMLIGTHGGGLNIWNGDEYLHFTEEIFSNNLVYDLLIQEDEKLWIATQKGLYKMDEMGFYSYRKEDGLNPSACFRLMEDHLGRIWIATNTGVDIWDGTGFNHFLDGQDVKALFEDSRGQVWIGTWTNGLYVWDGNEVRHFVRENGLSNDAVYAILEDMDGNIWIGTEGGGINVWDGEGFIQFTTEEGLSNDEVQSLAIDKYGKIWIGTFGGGINIWDGEGLAIFTEKEGLSDNSVGSLYIGEDQDVWAGTNRGLSKLELSAEGWPKSIKGYTQEDGVLGLTIRDIELDSRDRLWLAGLKGIDRIDLSAFEREPSEPIVSFRSIQPSFEFIDWHDLNALQEEDSDQSKGDYQAPRHDVKFDSVLAYSNLPWNPRFPHNIKSLQLSWRGIDWLAPGDLLYSYRLKNRDQDWSPLVTESELTYRNLAPGSYTFELKALSSTNQWSDSISYSFVVLPPFWLTWWAKLLYGILFVISFSSVLRWRTRKLKEKQIELEEIIESRTIELKTQKKRSDDLLLNILPEEVADELKETGHTQPRHFNDVSILFADFKGFTNIVASIPGKKLVSELDDIFQHFDDIMVSTGLEKIQTVGDAYVAAGGLPRETPDHAIRCVQAGKKMIEYLNRRNEKNAIKWKLRIGIHSGPISAGVVGKHKFSYDIFGDTVNLAARTESTSEEGKINVSAYTYDLIKDHFPCDYRGKINAKGKGDLDMYFVR